MRRNAVKRFEILKGLDGAFELNAYNEFTARPNRRIVSRLH